MHFFGAKNATPHVWLKRSLCDTTNKKGETFKKVAPDEQLMSVILAGIEQAKKSAQWLKDSGQFIPYPASWLNAKGWEDDYSTEVGGPQRQSKHGDGW